MAIAFDSSPAGNTGSGVTSLTLSITPTAGTCGVVGVSIRTTTSTVTSVTDNATGGSSTYTFRTAVNDGTSVRSELWSTGPTGVKSGATTLTINLSASTKVVLDFASYSGVVSVKNFTTNTGSSTSETITSSVDATSSWLVAALANQGTAAHTSGTGNLRGSGITSGGGAATNCGGAIADNTGATSDTCAVTLSASEVWAVAALELSLTAPPSFVPSSNYMPLFNSRSH